MCGRPETVTERDARDRAKLSNALDRVDRVKDLCADSKLVIAAARHFLDTLPKTKTVWRVTQGAGQAAGIPTECESPHAALMLADLMLVPGDSQPVTIEKVEVPI